MPENETVARTAADPTVHFAELKLGRKTYQLAFDFDAIARAEKMTGMSLLAGVEWANVGVERVRAMLFASAQMAHPQVTLEEFTPFIRPRYIGRIEAALVKAWMASQSDPETEEENSEHPLEPAPAAA